jgi:shikimate kinase
MNQTGVTVYLKYKAGFLLSRIQQSKKPRPLLLNVKDEEKLDFITNLLEKRENRYQKSRIIVENDRVSLEYIHEKLKDFIV